MKTITLLFLSCLCSICSMAQAISIEPSFDSKEKILYFTFTNTTDKEAWIHQSNPSGGTIMDIIFINKDDEEIGRKESVYTNDRTIILQPKEIKKAPIPLAIFGYTDVAKVRIEYGVAYNAEVLAKLTHKRDTVIFDWGD